MNRPRQAFPLVAGLIAALALIADAPAERPIHIGPPPPPPPPRPPPPEPKAEPILVDVASFGVDRAALAGRAGGMSYASARASFGGVDLGPIRDVRIDEGWRRGPCRTGCPGESCRFHGPQLRKDRRRAERERTRRLSEIGREFEVTRQRVERERIEHAFGPALAIAEAKVAHDFGFTPVRRDGGRS